MAIKHLALKKKPWLVKYSDPWNHKKRTISFYTEQEARDFENAQITLYEKEKAILRATRRRRNATKIPTPTVGYILERYIGTLSNVKTRISTAYHADKFKDLYGHRKASCITFEDVNAFISIQGERGVGRSTSNRRIEIVRSAFNWAVRSGVMPSNPLTGLRLPKSTPQVPDPPSAREIKLIYANAAPHVKRVVALGINTGARIGPSELFRLQWTDVDTVNGVLRMPNASKGARSEAREIPIRKELLEKLKVWEKEDAAIGCPWVINYKGRQCTNITRAWHAALRRAGIARRIRPYDLRHAFASRALEAGADLKCVAELMGHANEKMILRFYQHTNDKARRKAINMARIIPLE